MANPKKKHTRMRRDMRRSHNWRISAPNPSKCSHCGKATLSHRICPECGFYDGQLILPRKVKKKEEERPQE
ncbi:MAG: 50S ribosomal protein L32 [Elusimicrobia bacterium RIFCSPLOWO2_01_FULL_64_13]|nr:MAG: 50S ribosomal protein L32 [Elusimicrobia bacterium RIFCSPHIGHO2_01_FULL_64_10]OGR95024.1 MAG: 50S ribosomal protein L32 [Elusimicrobia bacterium RIFCSPLOWO2_01_FULL_64_13]